jgi:hypothetical protein
LLSAVRSAAQWRLAPASETESRSSVSPDTDKGV